MGYALLLIKLVAIAPGERTQLTLNAVFILMHWKNKRGRICRYRLVRLTCSHNKLICSFNMPVQQQGISPSIETIAATSKLLTHSNQ